jgi:hypothetical protein
MSTDSSTTPPPLTGVFRLFFDLRNKVWGLNRGAGLPTDKKGGPPILWADAVLLKDVVCHLRHDTGWVTGTIVWVKNLRTDPTGVPVKVEIGLGGLARAPTLGYDEFKYEVVDGVPRFTVGGVVPPDGKLAWLIVSCGATKCALARLT